MRKGQYFELDALIAILILVAGLIYVRTITDAPGQVNPDITADDEAIRLLRSMKVADLDNTYWEGIYSSTTANITDRDFSVARQMAIYATHGNWSLARNLSIQLLNNSHIPVQYGYGVYLRTKVDTKLLFNRSSQGENGTEAEDISTSRTLVSGLIDDLNVDPFAQWPAFVEVRVWI